MSQSEYSRAQIYLHWSMVVLIALQFLSGDAVSHFFHDMERGQAELGAQGFGANYHMIMGIVVLALGASRLTLRMVQGVPPHVKAGPAWTHKLANGVQHALYGFIFLTPLSGFVGVVLQTEFWLETHEVLKTILMLLIVAHIAGALYQLFILKSGSFQRMWRIGK